MDESDQKHATADIGLGLYASCKRGVINLDLNDIKELTELTEWAVNSETS